jgi:hypothetical protein
MLVTLKNLSIFLEIQKGHKKKKKYQTLGGRSYFFVQTKGDEIEITNSNGKVKSIDKNVFNSVFKRYKFLSDKGLHAKASYYTDPHWDKKECPSRIFSPYVAMVIHFKKKGV